MSVNLELPTIDGLKKLAPHKNPKKLVAPIRQIQNGIVDHRLMIGKDASMERSQSNKYLKHNDLSRESLSADSDWFFPIDTCRSFS